MASPAKNVDLSIFVLQKNIPRSITIQVITVARSWTSQLSCNVFYYVTLLFALLYIRSSSRPNTAIDTHSLRSQDRQLLVVCTVRYHIQIGRYWISNLRASRFVKVITLSNKILYWRLYLCCFNFRCMTILTRGFGWKNFFGLKKSEWYEKQELV